jgi:5-methyltetrahydrofolate--homocysteine methyltransferase
MKQGFLEKAKERTLIFDGAMGSLLMESVPPGEDPLLSNINQPEIVGDIHRKYIKAGADVVTTNTFGGNTIKLRSMEMEDQFEVLNRTAVNIAKGVCPPDGFVAGDLGPTGQFIKPLGDVSEAEMIDAYFQQVEILVKGGADLIIIETMFSLDECLAALKGAKQSGEVPVVASITYSKTKNGFYTMMGEGVAQVVSALETGGADVIATNCSLGSKDMIALTKEIKKVAQKPILIQPNAGQPVTQNGTTYYKQTPIDFVKDALKIKAAGGDMIGGCCGTTPEFILELVKMLDSSLKINKRG